MRLYPLINEKVRILKKDNSIWYGIGIVRHVCHEMKIISILMTSGAMKGRVGGFHVRDVRFKKR